MMTDSTCHAYRSYLLPTAVAHQLPVFNEEDPISE